MVKAQQEAQLWSYTLEASASTEDKTGQHFYLTSKNPMQAKWNCGIAQSAKLEIGLSQSEAVTSQKDAAVCTRSGHVTRPPRRLDL